MILDSALGENFVMKCRLQFVQLFISLGFWQTLSASCIECQRCTLHFTHDDADGCGEDANSSAAEVGAVEQMLFVLQWADGSSLSLWTERQLDTRQISIQWNDGELLNLTELTVNLYFTFNFIFRTLF